MAKRKIEDQVGSVTQIVGFARNVQDDLKGCIIKKVLLGINEKGVPIMTVRCFNIEKECEVALEIAQDGKIIFGQIFDVKDLSRRR